MKSLNHLRRPLGGRPAINHLCPVDEAAAGRVAVIDQNHIPPGFGRCKSGLEPRRACADDNKLGRGMALRGVRGKALRPVHAPKARHSADRRLEQVPGGPEESLVIEGCRDEAGKAVQHRQGIAPRGQGRVHAFDPHARQQGCRRRPAIRRADAVQCHIEDGIGFFDPSPPEAARAVILERAAHEMNAVGDQRRGERIAFQAGEALAARPGHSEHQTGLAVDVAAVGQGCVIQVCFGKTRAGRYVAKYAYRFGFIVRYPDGQTPITGYQYEPWHLRYVGVGLATEMRNEGVTVLENFWGLDPAPTY